MYSDADSDDDYHFEAEIYYSRRSSGFMRVLDEELYTIKDMLYTGPAHTTKPTGKATDKAYFRGILASPDLEAWKDWRRVRVQRVFEEMKGFHKGSLDLTGRSPARYEKIKNRFFPLVEEMRALSRFIISVPVQVVSWNMNTRQQVVHTINVPAVGNDAVWESFRRKWKIPSSVMYSDLHNWRAEALEVLSRYGAPVYQKLYIVQLPPELLAVVFIHAHVDDGRHLSSTCTYLRQIGASYVFSSRRLLMECPESRMDQLVGDTDPAEIPCKIRNAMLDYRKSCTDEIEFLMTRPDICSRIRSLLIGSRWMRPLFRQSLVAAAVAEPSDDTMFGPLATQYSYFLRSLQLQELIVQHLAFNEDLLSAIVSQPLHFAKFSFCRLPTILQQRIQTDMSHSSVEKLTILFRPGESEEENSEVHSIWHILVVCPILRVLYFNNVAPMGTLLLPEPAIFHHLACLNSLERMHLDGINYDISELTELFHVAASEGRLRLTHLKLYSAWYIEDDILLDFLRALHAGEAPLRVLAVDGAHIVSHNLFTELANLFPCLEALTLIRRDGSSQYQARVCRWPQPLYSYAECMRPLTRLRLFAANFRYNRFEVGPAGMCAFEQGYSTPSISKEDYISDSRALVLPFATYCPSLEWFYIVANHPLFEFKLLRLPNDGFELYEHNSAEGRIPLNEWNPAGHENTFPMPR